jgi:hypothetical protein
MTPVFKAEKKDDGRLIAPEYLEYIRGLKQGMYETLIRKPSKPKSRPEENYYHAVIIPMYAEDQGYTFREAHEYLLDACAPRDEKGRIIRTGAKQKGGKYFSDRPMTHDQYHNYVFGDTGCRNWIAREFGIVTPEPGEYE